MDGLKLVNSGLGRNAGDQLLIDISRRLHLAVRDRDVVARRGGQIFNFGFGPGIQDSIDIIAKRILMSFEQPFRVLEQDIFSSVCLGVSLTDGRESSEELLQEADIALAKSKKEAVVSTRYLFEPCKKMPFSGFSSNLISDSLWSIGILFCITSLSSTSRRTPLPTVKPLCAGSIPLGG